VAVAGRGRENTVTTVAFRRVARRRGPDSPQGELALQEPPAIPEISPGGAGGVMTYVPMVVMSGAMALMMTSSVTRAGPLMYVAAGLMVIAMVAMGFSQLARSGGERRFKMRGARRDYLRYLTQLRRSTRKAVEQQHRAMAWTHPDPAGLWALAMTDRMWERRASHDDFAEVRFALGEQRLGLRMSPVQSRPVEDLDPLAAHALRRFIRAYTTVSDLPVTLYLRGFRAILMRGDVDVVRGMTRAVLAQLATFHAPDELQIVVCADASTRAVWDWVKWLPHALHPTRRDATGPARMFVEGLDELDAMLGGGFTGRNRFSAGAVPSREEPCVVVVLDGGRVPAGNRFTGAGYRNAVLLDVAGGLEWVASPELLRLDVSADDLVMVREQGTGDETRTRLGRPDRFADAQARALARVLAPYRVTAAVEAPESTAANFDLAALLGLGDAASFDVEEQWSRRSAAEQLRVPIGITPEGRTVELDIKESAQNGFGPHGMLIGATGSGKSELLRTLVLALAVTHSSETLNFVLTDFKGGATFLGFEDLPHTSAVITNLADELPLVARMYDALRGELIRRQELLRRAGNYASIRDYHEARSSGVALDPLPSLFVVVDEFSELLTAYPDFIELFVMIGRLGRSLGVHLLLASQRLDDGRIHALETHLSYRIGLRTFSAMESRSVLGVPDAYELPPSPGNGYLRFDVSSMVRFKAAYVSGPYRAPARARIGATDPSVTRVLEYGTTPIAADRPEPAPERTDGEERSRADSVMRVIIDRLSGQGTPAHQVWLPPLADPPSLDQLMPPLVVDPDRGLQAMYPAGHEPLKVPIGVVDRPLDQRRELLHADVSGMGGHVGVAGGPQSGKTNLIRALITALALQNSPRDVQFYCLDFGGGGLTRLADLPHVGAVAVRADSDRVARVVTEVIEVLERREQIFAANAIDSVATYRQRRARGEFPEDEYGDVFLVVDGWGTLRQDFEKQETAIRRLTARGLNYGVHLVVGAARWNDIQLSMRDQIGSKFELRLGETIDSLIDMRVAATVPKVPGRGLSPDKLHFLTALPRIDGSGDPRSVAGGVTGLIEAVCDAWTGPTAPRLRILPDRLDAADLPPAEGQVRVAYGVAEGSLTPVWHDFAEQPHLTMLGDAESGKTNLLRLMIKGITERYGPNEAKILLVDLRRNLMDHLPQQYRMGVAVTSQAAREMLTAAAQVIHKRMPGMDLSPEQLRRRDWWSGAQLFIVLDDFELVTSMNSPLAPLVELLAYGADIGLHLIVARGAFGSARTGNDPALRKLAELNTPDLMLSCPPLDTPSSSKLRGRLLPVGRAQLATRRGALMIQTGHLAETLSSG
jgi:S-DNA-T family DNA segregation ATPase FtsK/SpoIIIE